MSQELHSLKETPQVRVFFAARKDQEVDEREAADDDPYDLEDLSHEHEFFNSWFLAINLAHDVLSDHCRSLDIIRGWISNSLRVKESDPNLIIIDVGRNSLWVVEVELDFNLTAFD